MIGSSQFFYEVSPCRLIKCGVVGRVWKVSLGCLGINLDKLGNYCVSSFCLNNKACLFCFWWVVSFTVFRWSSLESIIFFIFIKTLMFQFISLPQKEFLLYLIIYKVGPLPPFKMDCALSVSLERCSWRLVWTVLHYVGHVYATLGPLSLNTLASYIHFSWQPSS